MEQQEMNPMVGAIDGQKPAVRNPPELLKASLQANARDPFAYRGASFAPRGPSNGPDSHALDPMPAPSNPMRVQPGPLAKAAEALPATNPLVTSALDPAGSTAKPTPANPMLAAISQGASNPGGVVDDSASARRDWESSGRYTPQKQYETMVRNRMLSDLTDPTITDPAVRENAAKALGVMNQSAQAANPLDMALKQQRVDAGATANAQAERLATLQQQYLAETDPAKKAELADQIGVINGKGRGGAEQLSMPQHRSNAEIDAARARIAGLNPDEIKRKTANFTSTGRENPDFDPTLAKAVSLANRRKYGADDEFDQRQQAQTTKGDDGDVMTRFKADKAMQNHKTGQMTDQGLEVFDATGRLVGHYR